MAEYELSWDLAKERANLSKHGVSFDDAADALDDPLAIVHPDDAHSSTESRFVLVGESGNGRVVTVIFTIRGETARIISARASTRAERRRYMNEKNTIRDTVMEDAGMLEDYGHLEGWQRNQFRFRRDEAIVSLDPDVSSVFRTSEEVNAALRNLMAEGRVPSKSRG